MKARSIMILAVLLLFAATTVHSASAADVSPRPFEGKLSNWKGYDRYDFTFDTRPAIVVVPQKIAPGEPWLWRGEFFGAFDTVDLALLAKGWHLAYLDCHDTFGSPETLARWTDFYRMLTTEHAFSRKPVLLGMSRGGLYVYRWATLHPNEVGLIYGDAPVCDIKSWPGGKFKGKGSPGDWALFKKIFHLDEQQAMAWKGNPIDILGPIAKAHIPIIHVVGDADHIVPMNENTMILKERYEKLGGHVELIVKHGVGHHPHSLADPTPIVDYILKNMLHDAPMK